MKHLVFLHGWGASGACFAPLAEYFTKKGFTITAPDFPGFGSASEPLKPFTVFDYCDILYKSLKDAGVEKADFICHSFGARVGILLAARYPEAVGRLILADAAGVKPKRGIKYRVKVGLYKFKKFLVRIKLLPRRVLKNAGSADYRVLSPVMKRTFVNVVNEDLTPYLAGICAPTLIIFGENDRDTPLYMAKTLNEGIKDSGLVVLKDAGHFAFLDKPREFRLIAENFLRD